MGKMISHSRVIILEDGVKELVDVDGTDGVLGVRHALVGLAVLYTE